MTGDGYNDSNCDPVQGMTCDTGSGLCTGECAPQALGTSYIECDPDAVSFLRASLPERATAVVLDGPAGLDRWVVANGPAIELMRRLKERFDPAGACNPGVFVGGI